MKKSYLILLLFIQSLVSGQSLQFGVIAAPEIGDKESETKLNSVVQIINSQENLEFTIVSGNISAKGKNSELEKAKNILEKINSKYFVLPGESDSHYSESGSTKITELFGNDKFIYETGSSLFIGFNSSINRQTGGHLKPEDYKWLKENLSERDSTNNIYLFVYHNPQNEIDNGFKITSLLNRFNKSVIFYGSAKEYNVENILNIPFISIPQLSSNKNPVIHIFESRNDSLFIYEPAKGSNKLLNKISLLKKGTAQIIDSSSFINYETEILWNYDLNYTLEAGILTAGNLIYACDRSGLITCIDSTGNVVWEYDSFGTIINKPVVADGIFAVATLQGDLLTLDAATGESIQTIGFDDIITSPLITIEYNGPTNFMIPKLTGSKAAVVLGTSSGKLYCYDLETLQQIWVYDKVKGMIAAQPVYVQNKIIFPAFDNSLYCIDSRQGWLNWKWNGLKKVQDFPVLCNPVANNDNVYIVSPNGSVFAIDLLLGRTVWENEKLIAYESIGISEIGHRLFIKSQDDKFHIISAKTSNWVKEINMKYGSDKTNCSPIEYNGKVIFGTKNGNVYLVDENFKYKKLFFMGAGAVHTIQHFKDNMFAASNTDGSIVLFKLN